MPEYRLKLPAPHQMQEKVRSEAKRFNVVCCGRRWGKTTFGIDQILPPLLAGYPCGWFAPTNKQLAPAWKEIVQVLKPITLRKREDLHTLYLLTGGEVELWSMENEDVARGRKYKRIIVDEAAHIANLKDAWQLVIRATLADYQGDAWMFSTPKGMNYFKTLWDRGQDPLKKNWASWQMPTSTNPYILGTEIEEAREDLHELAFSQEYLAQFVNFDGAVFRQVTAAAVATERDEPEEHAEYVFGIDWGRSLDYTVVMVVDARRRKQVHLQRWSSVDYAVQRARIQEMYKTWRPALVLAESNSMGQPIIEQLVRDGVPVQPFLTTNTSKTLAIEGLSLAFERRCIEITQHPQLMAELQSFAAKRLPSGLIRYEAPSGSHDDCVMALAIAWSVVDTYGPRDQLVTFEDREVISPY